MSHVPTECPIHRQDVPNGALNRRSIVPIDTPYPLAGCPERCPHPSVNCPDRYPHPSVDCPERCPHPLADCPKSTLIR